MFYKKLVLSAFAAAVAIAQPAFAQDAAPTAGAKVTDGNHAPVGTVSRVEGQHVYVKTDKHEIPLPVSSFRAHEGAFLIGYNQAQLNAAYEETLAKAQQMFAVGTTVTGPAGAAVGTVSALDAESVTVKLASGKLVRLPRASVAAGPSSLVIGATAEQLEAAAGGAK